MKNHLTDEESGVPTPVLSEELRQEIIESNYGRDAGWIVEHENQPLALLTDCSPQDPDMFWDQYKLTLLTQDEALLARAAEPSFWYENEFAFRNRKYPDVGLPSGQMISPKLKESAVGARGLYLDVELPEVKETSDRWAGTWQWIKKWLSGAGIRTPIDR